MTDGFDPEFASRGDYVALYRGLHWQAVPALHPEDVQEGASWKRPAIEWRAHEHALVSDEQAQAWFRNSRASNVGVITGECSSGLWVLDLDLQRNAFAQSFLDAIVGMNGGEEFATPTQRTGGGGLQLFFRSFGHRPAPTGKTDVGVDIRGQGGFVMCPPSMHESGRQYEWLEGREPWRCATQDAPQFVIDAVERLLREHGHKTNAQIRERTDTPSEDRDPFGNRVDGREEYMTRLIWARLIDLRRILNEKPDEQDSEMFRDEAFKAYAATVASRLPGPREEALEREGRGRSAFAARWAAAMAKWDGPITQEAARPREVREAPPRAPQPPAADEEWRARDGGLFRVLSVEEIYALPDPKWLVDGMLIERSFSLLYGAPGTGKSFIALGIALAVAQGGDWWGRAVKRTGPVLYISSEGTADLKFRLAAYASHWGTAVETLPFGLIAQTMSFMDTADLQRLVGTIEARIAQHGQPVLIVVDTVSRVLPGADENLQKDMTTFIRGCDLLRERFDACVLGVHHTSRAGNLRGSTVFDGAADALFSIERDEVNRWHGKLTAAKVKAAMDGWVQGYELARVDLDPLKGLQSLVAIPRAEPSIQQLAGGPQSVSEPTQRGVSLNTQGAILRAAQKAWEEGAPWHHSATARMAGRHVIERMTRFGLTPEEAQHLAERWAGDGVWSVERQSARGARLTGYRVTGKGSGAFAVDRREDESGEM